MSSPYIENATALFRYYKHLAEGAITQVPDSQLTAVLDPRMNSIAVMMKHLSGNMLSRWTDFLTTDGEKPSRDKAAEFQNSPTTRQALLDQWEAAWTCAFTSLATLTDADLTKTITIRAEPMSVLQAINRQLTHCSYHVGQIAFMAKHLTSEHWKPLKVSRG
ncbi:MAG TPA: DUF1572 family protein [Bryobacteraceae bacterium]|nr:DUF1572 family protein [Bryobacteraceae bacterium]